MIISCLLPMTVPCHPLPQLQPRLSSHQSRSRPGHNRHNTWFVFPKALDPIAPFIEHELMCIRLRSLQPLLKLMDGYKLPMLLPEFIILKPMNPKRPLFSSLTGNGPHCRVCCNILLTRGQHWNLIQPPSFMPATVLDLPSRTTPSTLENDFLFSERYQFWKGQIYKSVWFSSRKSFLWIV